MDQRPTSGFTLIELLIVIIVFSVLASAALPTVSRVTTHTRVNQAAMLVGQDLSLVGADAARQRKPVRLARGVDRQSYTISDRVSGNVLQTRVLGPRGDFPLDSVSFSASPIDVFPNGFTSSALTVTLWAGGYSRRVTMSRAGWVRVP
jgi:prepilin-type N-terminal cleavage/methylation domain-containing protein